MRIQGNGNSPWDKIWKFLTNPTVEVLAAIVVVLVSAWVVVESESMSRRSDSAFPVLFGHK
jgi:hypothetical protein